ncbi:MAG: hypothetical protein AAFZ52_15575 [Bacteroidota bacterium]
MFTLTNLLLAVGTVVVLMLLHETAHYLSARAMNLRVIDFGFKTDRTVPYPFVEVGWTPDVNKRTVYLMAGVATTASLLLLVLLLLGARLPEGVYLGFAVQLLLETNPVFSDFTLLRAMSAGRRKATELFSTTWYVHFLIWAGLLVFLLSPRFVPGWVLQ